VLDPAGDYRHIARFHCLLLVADTKVHRAFDHPNDLLMRMLVSGGMRARLHAPINHCSLPAGDDPAPYFVSNLLLRY
jgi:hypothetical protein